VWDHGLELLDITTIDDDVSTDGSGENVAWELEEVIGNLGGTWIFVVETGDEDGLTAVWVEFLVDSTLWENVQLEGGDVGVDDTGTVLKNNGAVETTDDWNVQFGSTGMGMWGIETAWAEETHGHSGTGTDQGWESLSVGNNDTTSITSGNLDGTRWVSEVENEVLILEQSDTIEL